MKYLLVMLLSIIIAQTPVFKKDYAMHFAAGYITAHATRSIIIEYTDNEKFIKFGPLVAAITIGVTKELVDKYDSNPKSTFEWQDMLYTAGGGVTLISFTINKR
jgi:hypothetical protein